MSSNEYHFITNWRIAGTVEEVFDLIGYRLDFPRWWPSVYLDAQEIEPGDVNGLGRAVRFHTKGWLPYTIRWDSRAIETQRPSRLVIRATGDFEGRGIWIFQQDGGFVNASFDWKLTADKPLLRYLSFLLKPVFAANHRWAMARGKTSLELELARRHAAAAEPQRIRPPPPPNRTSGMWLAAATVIVMIGLVALVRYLF